MEKSQPHGGRMIAKSASRVETADAAQKNYALPWNFIE
jgi:hypothetical protein